jgi:hypothetical protein
MTTENTLTIINSFHQDLKITKELIYDKCALDFTNPQLNTESAAYGACSFRLNGKTIEHRVSKITPAKTGQFVTIWKRNKNGITEPFNISDDIDFVIITSRSGNNLGQFIFPKSILAEKEIITKDGKEGKRGIRVYPPWDIVNSRQAEKTKSWQIRFFLAIKNGNSTDLNLIKKYFKKVVKLTTEYK